MQITLFRKDGISRMALPEKVSGHYRLDGNRIGIEGVLGRWILKPGKNVWLTDTEGNRMKETVLEPLTFYTVLLQENGETAFVYTEPVTGDRKTFQKLLLPWKGKIVIGRGCECDIVYENAFVSARHGEILLEPEGPFIRDLDSANGIFVNDRKIRERRLKPGDVVSIMGLKLILGKGFFAMNNPDHSVTYNTAFLREYVKQEKEAPDEEEVFETEEEYFYRSPRFKRDIETAVIALDGPPPPVNQETLPMVLMVGPSLTMGMASLSMAVFTIVNVMTNRGNMLTAMPTIIMSGSMLLGTVLWPVLTRQYEKRKNRKKEKLRKKKYLQYLDEKRVEIDAELIHQKEILCENHIPAAECVRRIEEKDRALWERVKGQNDFLTMRLGTGELPLDAKLEYPRKKFTMDDDTLQDALYKLAESPKSLFDVPITCSLEKQYISGLIGERSAALSAVRGIILQIAALHSYDEVKMVFLYRPEEETEWKFAKWLPHVWDNARAIRFLSTTVDNAKELSVYFEKLFYARRELPEKERQDCTPHYIIFAADQKLASRMEAIRLLLNEKEELGVSLVTLYDQLKNLPKECATVIELSGEEGKIYDKDDITGKRQTFVPDIFLEADRAEQLAVRLSNIRLDLSSQRFALPNMLTFLELFQVGKAEHLNVLDRWKENNPTLTLRTPVGVDRQGELFYLDLHEKFHGPHGLIAGMTGSGKSEFIITFILSLAVNYHPDEIAFILIDYKGGGLAGAFENDKVRLPHLAGTITNLDGAAVTRSLISIQSELRRRQAVFNEARKRSNEGTMDIYKYQKLYREGVVDEPVPHLFIISDEFAELKTQQPEFMAQLISAARIGRSLGVHLILATQKPAGVVDDQIWSNSRFRVCLKVQEKADSMDMIKRPDAAEIAATGRFYLQVGFNELFDMGQSAWCGADYEPADKLEKKVDNRVAVVDELGRVVREARPRKKTGVFQTKQSQVVAVMEYLTAIAREENVRTRPLWLDVIPAVIGVDELKEKYRYRARNSYTLNPAVGELDDPFNQSQRLLTLPLSEEGNAIIYGIPGSGKTTFLCAALYSLLEEHSAQWLNLYLLDFEAETLRVFRKAPQTGDVLFSGDEERIENLFRMLKKEMEGRKKRFADRGGSYRDFCREGGELPAILVVISNFAAFYEMYSDRYEDVFVYLSREGVKYGIYFMITASNGSAVKFKIAQNFKQTFVLQMNDSTDYSTVIGSTGGMYPSKIKGRGLIRQDNIYEFQTAHPTRDADYMFDAVARFCETLSQEYKGKRAKKVPVLPKQVTAEFLRPELAGCRALPVGVNKRTLSVETMDVETPYIFPVFAQDAELLSFFGQGLAEEMKELGKDRIVVLDAMKNFQPDEKRGYRYLCDGFEDAVGELFHLVVERHNAFKDAGEAKEASEAFEPAYYILNSYAALFGLLSADRRDKLGLLLDRGRSELQIHFILLDVAGQVSAYSMNGWYKKNIAGGTGLWLGDGFMDQYHLKTAKTSGELYQEVGPEFGYLLTKGKYKLIKVLTTGCREELDE